MKRLEIDGGNARAELYELLSRAKIRYALAVDATTHPEHGNDSGTTAGLEIFQATYNAVSFFKWEGHLPSFDELPSDPAEEMVLPFPIFISLEHFLKSAGSVSLASWKELRTGNREIDAAIISWPNTILRGTPEKLKFLFEIFSAYAGQPVEKPILSQQRVRAAQLLVIGQYLLNRELIKIGQPPHGKIITLQQ